MSICTDCACEQSGFYCAICGTWNSLAAGDAHVLRELRSARDRAEKAEESLYEERAMSRECEARNAALRARLEKARDALKPGDVGPGERE